MEYAFKLTTAGLELVTACGAEEKPLKLTRVTFGSGKIPEGNRLSDQLTLISPVADGTIIKRSHQDNRLDLVVRYSNKDNPDQETFAIGEFIVYAEHPTTQAETALIYATLGDYAQPVPKYSAAFPPSTFSFPMVVIVSDNIQVTVETAPGSVNFDDMDAAIQAHGQDRTAHQDMREEMTRTAVKELTIPTSGWEYTYSAEDGDEVQDPPKPSRKNYPYQLDLKVDGVTADHVPAVLIWAEYLDIAVGLCPTCEAVAGAVRFYAAAAPKAEIKATVVLTAPGKN